MPTRDVDRTKPQSPSQSGTARAETYRKATAARRKRLLESGKVEIRTFVEPDTKATLQALKQELGIDPNASIGAVLDAWAKQRERK